MNITCLKIFLSPFEKDFNDQINLLVHNCNDELSIKDLAGELISRRNYSAKYILDASHSTY